jgi:hypothetical protein
MDITWTSKDDLFPIAKKNLFPAKIILDIGCGIKPQNLIMSEVHICCEPHYEYVEQLQNEIRTYSCRHLLILNTTWNEVLKLFPPRSVDSIFLLDVIEHLDKEEGKRLLQESEKIVKNQIAIFTPLGFIPMENVEGKDAWGLHGGEWQVHKSGWEPKDFDKSWKIIACKKFHLNDAFGKKLKKPHGAFFAIKTLKNFKPNKERVKLSKRKKTHWFVDKTFDILERK